MPHPEIELEQAHVDRAYARLEDLKAVTTRRLGETREGFGPGGTFADRLNRDVAEASGTRRLTEVSIGDSALCFGRTDDGDGQTLHVGRVGVGDANGDVLVVDWRAPAAEPFYRATAVAPMGLTLRRQFLTNGRRILDLDDEIFGRDRTDQGRLRGEASLLAALTQARTGRMGDIVATIQHEQDVIIRAPLAGVLVVQGGPGTGKTAVALHRAAYLLYTHRVRLGRAGVLVIGPNPIFVRYIEHVLPSLGESSVVLATVAGLVDGIRPTIEEPPAVAALKGDGRMTRVLANGVELLERPLTTKADIPFGTDRLPLTRATSAKIVERVKAQPGPHNARRPVVEASVLSVLWQRHQRMIEGRGGHAPDESERAGFERDLRSTEAVRTVLHRMWPVLTPQRLLELLLSSAALLTRASTGILTEEEVGLLYREGVDGWSAADIALLDEAAALLGERPVARAPRSPLDPLMVDLVERTLAEAGLTPECPNCNAEMTMNLNAGGRVRQWVCTTDGCGHESAPSQLMDAATALRIDEIVGSAIRRGGPPAEAMEGVRQYGHILVDEAQELSPMAWRMVARRCPSGSMTIVGDLGQGSAPWAASTWAEVTDLLPGGDRGSLAELTVNYRTPTEIMNLAARVLAVAAPEIEPPTSVRDEGRDPEILRVDDLETATADAVARLRSELPDGHLAVIAPRSDVVAFRLQLGGGEDVLESGLAVLDAELAKGLEFDAVVLVEPAAVAVQVGLRGLYVALTRATRRLVIVHREPLPPGLAT